MQLTYRLRLFVLWPLVLATLFLAISPLCEAQTQTIHVVMDNNYPPYVFQNNHGKLQGILIDQWQLWEQKTGTKVEIHAMDWGKALSAMRAGEFDVIDTVFMTQDRSVWLDFTRPYARLEVPIFFINAISGITDASSLKGFSVAVKTGDAAVDILKSNGVNNLMLFDSYEAVILAAKEHKVTVFVVDAPPGYYFLNKLGIQNQFKQSVPLNVGHFHRAVKKGNQELLKMVEEGFAKISKEEYEKIHTKWCGSSVEDRRLLRFFLMISGSLSSLMLLLFVWNRVLRKRVTIRTAELKASVEALRSLSIRQEAILAAVPDIIMEVNINKVYTWANPAGLDFFGEDVIGKEAAHFFEDEQDTYQTIQPLFGGKEQVIYIESWQRRKDGEKRLLAWWCEELRSDQGIVKGAISTARDITDRIREEAELQKIQNLTSVGTLAGGIAHDFNNILMGLYGNISLARNELSKEHPGFKPLEDAERSMGRAIRLTKQLLTFAKGGEPIRENFSLGLLVEEVAEFDLSGSNVILLCNTAADLWLANADKGQIQQVISNLTLNARQAMPNGGHLFINVENRKLPPDAIPGLPQGNYVKITVRDEGTGIAPQTLPRIFDPYFSTKQTGHGLGLATAYSIINKHNGYIGVDSELGKGTTFTIYLPTPAAPQLSSTKSVDVVPQILKSSPKILVLDDDEYILAVIPRWLKKYDCSVETTLDGLQAIEMYKRSLSNGPPFDVVILDLTIPGGIGGQEVVKQILTLDPGAKAIVSSGYAEGSIMSNYYLYGFKGVLTKPYTQFQLYAVLNGVLN
jgi:two-component system cell cycle sensor histidine kinase/response regulator CckA